MEGILMKKCIIITLSVMCCVHMSSAMNSIRSNIAGFLSRYKDVYTRMANVDHGDFAKAWQENQRLSLYAKAYQDELEAAQINDFDPFKDSPEEYANRLSEEQVDALDKRLQ